MTQDNGDEVTGTENIIEANSQWTTEEPAKKTNRGWLNRPIVSGSGASKRIQELELQVKQLAKRPNIFELDEAEITALAGEDAATLIRAAKAKAQSVLLDAENQAKGIKESIAAQIAATRIENNKLVEDTKADLDKQKLETENYLRDLRNKAQSEYRQVEVESKKIIDSATSEANSILENAKSQELRIISEATKRSEELLMRANAQAQSEATTLLQEAQVERDRLKEQLEAQRVAAAKLAEESSRVRNSLATYSTTTKQVLSDILIVATELEQKTQIIADKSKTIEDSI
ncbi:MAG: hypothetical protein ACKN9B_00760 [Actinomycetes bacterium]